jgi:hypothetical protein
MTLQRKAMAELASNTVSAETIDTLKNLSAYTLKNLSAYTLNSLS